MSPGDIKAALKLNREFPEDLPQRLFSALVLDEAMPEIGADVQRLRDLLQTVTLLRGKIPDLPDERTPPPAHRPRGAARAPRHLAGRQFRGRLYELMRLGVLLDGESTKPLLVHGIGGSGKSALIARFLLDRQQGVGPGTPFVFLDCDRPDVVAEEPITLVTEAVRQLGRSFPSWPTKPPAASRAGAKHSTGPERRSRVPGTCRSGAVSRRYSIGEEDRSEIHRDFLRFLRRVLLPGDRLLFAVDTFEEVQRSSRDAVGRFWEFLAELGAAVPGLRVVVAGRAELTDRPPDELDQLPLGDLDPQAAQEVIEAGGVPASIAAKVVQLVGGNPLCLRMALQVLQREGLDAFTGLATDDSAVSGEIRSQLVQGFLYKRILQHLDDKDVEKLAFPGLTVRRIDEMVIREVLAEPCGLEVPDDQTARDLFDRLAREVALVQIGKAGTVPPAGRAPHHAGPAPHRVARPVRRD